MPKINTYAIDGTVTNNDKVIGTDSATGETKNYLVSDIVALAGGGGGGGVTDFTSTAGTFVSVTANSAATGSVSIGTVDLSATGTPSASTFLRGDNTWSTTGDVVGPASAIDLSIPVFDGTTGKLLKDATGVTIDATGNVTLQGWPETDAEFRGDLDGGVRFTAQAAENISKGDVVYISGAVGDNTQVRKARADSASTMTSFGFAYNTATSGNPIQVVTFGNIYGSGTYPLDTTIDSDGNAITVGDTLYVSPTTYGGWTNVRPTGAADLVQNIGKVTRVNANNGAIKVGGAGRSNDTPNTISTSGNITSLLNIEGASIIKTGGTSSQLLKADGSVGSINNLTETGSSILTITGGTGSVIGSGTTIQVTQASSLNNGYLSSTDWITFNSKLTGLVNDTSPTLGGNLDVGNGTYSIISELGSNANINITPDGTGAVVLDGLSYPTADGSPGDVLTTNGSGVISFTTPTTGTVTSVSGTGTAGGLTLTGTVTSSGSLTLGGSLDISTDASPQLGGQLDANTNSITNAGKFQGDQFQSILNTLTAGTITWDADSGVYAELALSTNSTLAITNLGVGTPAVLKVTQDATTPGNNITAYTVSGGTVKWPGGSTPTITAAVNSIDIITFISDGTDIYASIVQDFK